MLRLTAQTEIRASADRCFDRPHAFSDVLCGGLFRHFGHRYTFQALGANRTLMTDEFWFESPCGPVGMLFDRLLLRRPMKAVLDSRALFIKRVAETDAWQRYLSSDENGTVLAKGKPVPRPVRLPWTEN